MSQDGIDSVFGKRGLFMWRIASLFLLQRLKGSKSGDPRAFNNIETRAVINSVFLKIWTCGSSPRSGSRKTWTRIKTVNGASHLSNFCNFFGAILFPVGRDWWPWTKPGYITMTRRQSNNQWSGVLAANPDPKKILVQKSARKVLALIFWDQDGILPIDYLSKGQTTNAEYYLSLLVQLKDILKEKRHGKFTKGVLFLHDNAPAHRNPLETGLPGLPMSWSPTLFSRSGPVRLPPVPWTEKTIERSLFFFRRGGNSCRGDLVGRTRFWFFF